MKPGPERRRLLGGRLTPDPARIPPEVERVVWLARAALFWERLWPAMWPGLGFVALFLVVTFLDLWRFFPAPLGALGVAALLAATAWSVWRNCRTLHFPTRGEGLRRVERDSGLTHRPLTAFEDRPFTELKDKASRRLWALHRERLMRAFNRLRLKARGTELSLRDPYALRLPAAIAVAVSLMVAGPDWDDRLFAAVTPSAAWPAADVEADVWIAPPEYTAGAPLFLTGAGGVAEKAGDVKIEVPVGSVMVARVTGASRDPDLRVRGREDGARVTPEIQDLGNGVREVKVTLDQDARVRLRAGGRALGSWEIAVRADRPPEVEMSEKPAPTATGAVRFAYAVKDDYGVVKAQARLQVVPKWDEEEGYGALELTPAEIPQKDDKKEAAQKQKEQADKKDESAESAKGGETDEAAGEPERPAFYLDPSKPVLIGLPLSGERVRDSKEVAIEALAAHPWAGREVLVQFVAEDDLKQKGFSKGVKMVLPERSFAHPLARAIIEQRRALAADPDAFESVAQTLNALSLSPERFIEDKVVYLGLRGAYWRLSHRPRAKELQEVYDLLWDLALRLEDGGLALALQRLRDTQQALMDALDRGASDEEIRRLMAELRQAIAQYIQALAEAGPQEQAQGQASRMMGDQDLSKLLDQLQDLAETGARSAARDLLSDLSALLENLQVAGGGQGGQGQGGMTEGEAALAETLEDLNELIGKERTLLDETFRSAQEQSGIDIPGLNRLLPPGTQIDPRLFEPGEGLEDLEGLGKNRGLGENRGLGKGGGNPLNNRSRRFNDLLNGNPSLPGLSPPGAEGMQPFADGGNALENKGAPGFSNPGRPGKASPSPEGQALARKQESIRKELEALKRALGERGTNEPQALSDARDSMAAARESLERGRLADALDHERDAIEHLRDGGQQLGKELLDRMAQRGQGGGFASEAGRDPLGREAGSNGFDLESSVRVPDESDLQRARRILDELRRRAAERGRPAEELDYLERLLKRF